tara:strand:+ start:213 stop:461 length:249 start_codon:yes stop_codon:yes gene_type:complete
MNFLLSLMLICSLVGVSSVYQKPVNLFRVGEDYVRPMNIKYFNPDNNLFFFKELKSTIFLGDDAEVDKSKGKRFQYEDRRGC